MIVRELIKELKKYNMDAEVAWQDHDQSEDEINAKVINVFPFDWKTSFDPQYCKGVGVVLSP